jgi:predicted enzyme related to lactoylglutathione lyase
VPHGSFCTAVLRSSDPQRSAAFYNAVIGWTVQPSSDDKHQLFQAGGRTAASLLHITSRQDSWIACVSVENVERASADAIALGATLTGETSIEGVAQLATLRDPEGAELGLWQPAPLEGAELTDAVGSIWWIELLSNDLPRAHDFYRRLFGWTTVDRSFEPFELYQVFTRGETQEGGLVEFEVSPQWNVIISVNDCDATIRQVESLGGAEIFTHTVPKYGRIGGFFDPAGARMILRGPVPVAQS